jgi:hypothetical protein
LFRNQPSAVHVVIYCQLCGVIHIASTVNLEDIGMGVLCSGLP